MNHADLEFAEATDRGRVRDHNEDYLGCALPEAEREHSHGWLFALADGVGGQEKGEVASRTAVETLLAEFSRRGARSEPLRSLPRLVQTANEKVFEAGLAAKAARRADGHYPGSLRPAVRSRRGVARGRFALLPDSRRPRQALTRDHTMVSEQARLGLISDREAAEAETRHVLTRSLGSAMFVGATLPSTWCWPAMCCCCAPTDCTARSRPRNGGNRHTNADLNVAARQLIDAANERDGGDNVSVQLIRVRSVERIGMYRGRPYKLA
jgi:PPM family protein phosphatase